MEELGADFHFQSPSVSSSFVPNYLRDMKVTALRTALTFVEHKQNIQ